MFMAELLMGDVQDIKAEGPQPEGPATDGPEEEVSGLCVLVDKGKVTGAEVIDSGSSVFFVVVAVAALTFCIVIGSSRMHCARPRTASQRASSASMDDGRFKVGESWGFCIMSFWGAGH